MKTVRIVKTLLAALNFAALLALFADATGRAADWWGFLAKIQFVPAVLALDAVALLFLAAVTFLFGRAYCTVVCPLGVAQDVLRFVSRRKVRRVCTRLPESASFFEMRISFFMNSSEGNVYQPSG